MRKSTGENMFLVLFLLVGIAVFYGSATMKIFGTEPFNGSDYGRVISGMLVVAVLGKIIASSTARFRKKDHEKVEFLNLTGLAIVFAISIFYCFGITQVGYFTSTFIFSFVMISILADNKKIKRIVAYGLGSLAFCILLYFMFKFMQVYMPNTPLI
jgi:Tripartite tricarboxylate transporter TctB family.